MGVGTYQTTSTTLDDGEISTVEAALVLYQAYAQRELAKDCIRAFTPVFAGYSGAILRRR